MYGNRQAPSRDIANKFCTMSALFCTSQGQVSKDHGYVISVYLMGYMLTYTVYYVSVRFISLAGTLP